MKTRGTTFRKRGMAAAAILLGAGILLDLGVKSSGQFLFHVSELYMTGLCMAVFLLQGITLLFCFFLSQIPEERFSGRSLGELLLLPGFWPGFASLWKETAGILGGALLLLAANTAVSTANAMTGLAAAAFFLDSRRISKLFHLASSMEAFREAARLYAPEAEKREFAFSRIMRRKEAEDPGILAGELASAALTVFQAEFPEENSRTPRVRILECRREELTEEEARREAEKGRSLNGLFYAEGIYTSQERAEALMRERYCSVFCRGVLEFSPGNSQRN